MNHAIRVCLSGNELRRIHSLLNFISNAHRGRLLFIGRMEGGVGETIPQSVVCRVEVDQRQN